jgi:septation ring formation regulator EzrA
MKHREPVLRKLDSIESNLNKLNFTLNQGNRDGAFELMDAIREQVNQIKGYIENEPIIGNEMNSI